MTTCLKYDYVLNVLLLRMTILILFNCRGHGAHDMYLHYYVCVCERMCVRACMCIRVCVYVCVCMCGIISGLFFIA